MAEQKTPRSPIKAVGQLNRLTMFADIRKVGSLSPSLRPPSRPLDAISGVRPSSGAATPEKDTASEISDTRVRAQVAAAEDSRTPVKSLSPLRERKGVKGTGGFENQQVTVVRNASAAKSPKTTISRLNQ